MDPSGVNDYLYWRLDGCLLDPTFARIASPPESKADVQEMITTRARKSPNALGQMINHPGAGIEPNVVTWMVELNHQDIDQSLLPNAEGETAVPSAKLLAFLTTTDLEPGDELFLNYRYEVGHTEEEARSFLPNRYEPVTTAAGKQPPPTYSLPWWLPSGAG